MTSNVVLPMLSFTHACGVSGGIPECHRRAAFRCWRALSVLSSSLWAKMFMVKLRVLISKRIIIILLGTYIINNYAKGRTALVRIWINGKKIIIKKKMRKEVYFFSKSVFASK